MGDLAAREKKLKAELKQLQTRIQREKEKECYKILTSLVGTDDIDKIRQMISQLQSSNQNPTAFNKTPVIKIDEDDFFNN